MVLTESRVSWVLDLSGKGRFFDLPFPTELRRQSNGSIKMDDFPRILGLEAEARIKDAVAHGFGYSTGTVIYFRFSRAIDESNLPAPKETFSSDSPLFLIDIDPDSPERGRRFPLLSHFYHKPPLMMPNSARNLLAIQPFPSFVLRERGLYAAGVMRSLGDRKGLPLAISPALVAIAKGRTPEVALGNKAFDIYGPALEALSDLGVSADEISALTVFRTGDPTERMLKLFDGVKDRPTLEFETPLAMTREYDLFYVLEGAVMMPQFQDGLPPYGHGQGGRLQFDVSGKPVVQRMERVPICLSVPKSRMPERGFPIMILIHGTGGTSTGFVDNGEVTEEGPLAEQGALSAFVWGRHHTAEKGTGMAMVMGRRGISVVSAAQPLNGERGGLDTQLYFYNFLSPQALRDNMLQSAAEASMLLRLIQRIEIDPALCPEIDTGGGPMRFDPELIFGMGHSLGSLILAPWGAVETDVKALIPSGNGAYWNLFLAGCNVLDIKRLERRGEGMLESAGFDQYHPMMTLITTVLAPADTFVFEPRFFKDPLPGREPKHVWASFGIYDSDFSTFTQNAAILSMGLDFAGPLIDPSTGPMLDLAGLDPVDYPVRLNKNTPRGEVTGVAVQYEQAGPRDGHFINAQRQDAKYQYACFLESLVDDGAPTTYAPKDKWDAECGP
jgi:hypothetical protein